MVEGPLAPFADGLRDYLAGQGFATDTIVGHVHRLADLSGWLFARGLTTAAVTSEITPGPVGARIHLVPVLWQDGSAGYRALWLAV